MSEKIAESAEIDGRAVMPEPLAREDVPLPVKLAAVKAYVAVAGSCQPAAMHSALQAALAHYLVADEPAMSPLDWMRLGARAARLSAGAQCGNHWESAQEDAMTSSGLGQLDKQKLYAEANAAEEIRKQIDGTCEDAALGYAAYMASEEDKALLAGVGVTSNWHYRREVGIPSRMESVA